jgi:hypothetical protein
VPSVVAEPARCGRDASNPIVVCHARVLFLRSHL